MDGRTRPQVNFCAYRSQCLKHDKWQHPDRKRKPRHGDRAGFRKLLNMKTYIASRSKRKAKVCASDLFQWSRDAELLTIHSVRSVAHRTKASPALALTIAELSGLLREVRA